MQSGNNEPIFVGGYDLTDLWIILLIVFSITTTIVFACMIYHYYKKTTDKPKKGLITIIAITLIIIGIYLFLCLETQDSAKHNKTFSTTNIEYSLCN